MLSFLLGAWSALLRLASAIDTGESHQAPVPLVSPSSRGISGERQNILSEMWQRRILPPEMDQWGPEDMALLLRVRGAEAAGAIPLLRRRFADMRGLFVLYKPVGGLRFWPRLTKQGFEKYLLLKSQEALTYFESKDIDAKWAFLVTDMEGRRLFDSQGLLTAAGDELYNRILAGLSAHWRAPNGEIFGNRPPSDSSPETQSPR